MNHPSNILYLHELNSLNEISKARKQGEYRINNIIFHLNKYTTVFSFNKLTASFTSVSPITTNSKNKGTHCVKAIVTSLDDVKMNSPEQGRILKE